MNSFLDPVGARPPAVYWRRRALFAAALAMLVLFVARACSSGGPPELGTRASAPGPVPLVSTYTPTPKPTEKIIGAGKDALPGFQSGGSTASERESGSSISTGEGGSISAAAGPARPLGTAGPAAKPTATPSGGGSAGGSTPTGSRTATPKPSPVPTKIVLAGPTTCKASALDVTLRADARRYSGSKTPKFYIGVQNIGKKSCLVDLGSGALSVTVVSGKDRIWSSDDCQGKPTKDIRLLEPGQKLEARSVWSRVRSQPGCPKGMPSARPGTYVAEGSAAGVEAERRVVFQIG